VIGPELAALLAPFAKWGALVTGMLVIVWLVRFWVRQSAKEAERLVTMQDAQEEERDARKSIKDRAAAMRDDLLSRARRGDSSVPHDEDRELPGSG
jgi:hypothetical protein